MIVNANANPLLVSQGLGKIVDSGINRFRSAFNYPKESGPDFDFNLLSIVDAPSNAYQNRTYQSAANGLGSVFSDITSGNFSNLPSSVISGLGSGDIGAYAVVGLIALTVVPLLFKGGSKARSRAISRKAALKGAIARDQELLKAA